MTGPASRRGFLRGLTTLPLIGGSVALVGSPSAVAAPVTGGMVGTYLAWLHFEANYLLWGCNTTRHVPMMNHGACFHSRGPADPSVAAREAIMQAPLILAAAGCLPTCAEAEDQCGYLGPQNWRPVTP